jgi:hypothetical protein
MTVEHSPPSRGSNKMQEVGRNHVAWRRSSACVNNECVEVAFVADGDVLIRQSRIPHKVIRFDVSEWDAFLQGVHAGEFD